MLTIPFSEFLVSVCFVVTGHALMLSMPSSPKPGVLRCDSIVPLSLVSSFTIVFRASGQWFHETRTELARRLLFILARLDELVPAEPLALRMKEHALELFIVDALETLLFPDVGPSCPIIFAQLVAHILVEVAVQPF